jgi:hypothetical protein
VAGGGSGLGSCPVTDMLLVILKLPILLPYISLVKGNTDNDEEESDSTYFLNELGPVESIVIYRRVHKIEINKPGSNINKPNRRCSQNTGRAHKRLQLLCASAVHRWPLGEFLHSRISLV